MTDLADSILESSAAVLLYEPGHYDAARDIMHEVVEDLASLMLVSDPSLENLAIIDTAEHLHDWPEWFPAVSVRDVAEGEYVLHRHQVIISLAPDFLRRRSLSEPHIPGATRFYALTPQAAIASRVPIDTIIELENVA